LNQIFYKKLLITVLATLIVYILSALITKVLLKKEEAIRTKHLTRKWIGYIRTIIYFSWSCNSIKPSYIRYSRLDVINDKKTN